MKKILLTTEQETIKTDLLQRDFKLEKICNDFNESVDKMTELNSNHLKNKSKVKIKIKEKTISKEEGLTKLADLKKVFSDEKKIIVEKQNQLMDEMDQSYVAINKEKTKKTSREAIGKIREQLKVLKSQIAVEKKEAKIANTGDKEVIKKQFEIIDKKYQDELNELKNEYNTIKIGLSKTMLMLMFIVSVVSVLIVALTVNYLVYYPQANNGASYDFTSKESIIALALSGILLVLAGVISYLLLKSSSKLLPLERKNNNFKKGLIIGYITDFFDTIGIGSFAPTVVFLKAMNANEDDKKIPGILNVGHTIPVIFEAIIFIAAVEVDPYTLISLISMSVLGSYLGAMLANKINTKMIKLIMGILLSATAVMMILSHPMISVFKGSGNEIGLPFNEWKIYVCLFIFLILGALMSLGIGLYAPAMAVITLMGMNVTVAFPIMMGSTAFLMPFGSIRFIQDRNYAPKVTVAITIGGVLGVISAFLAIFVGFAGNTEFVQYLLFVVIVVIFYTSISMLYDFYKITKREKLKKE